MRPAKRTPNPDFGSFLKEARLKKGLTQLDVARKLKLNSAQSVSDWERNYGASVPLRALRRLIDIYELSLEETFERLYEYQAHRLHEKLRKQLRA